MAFTGKYDFKGIKKLSAAGLKVALAQSPYTIWLLKGGTLLDILLEAFSNWLANNGLMLLNIGADFFGNNIDQKRFDDAMDAAMNEITKKGGRDKLTDEEKRKIDNEVIKAARKFIVIGNT